MASCCKGGVQIYEYEPTVLRTKTIVVDGIFSVLGSSNFDARSAQINEELDTTVYDKAFGREMQEVFERDLTRSRRYTFEDFEKRSLWDRFIEWVCCRFIRRYRRNRRKDVRSSCSLSSPKDGTRGLP